MSLHIRSTIVLAFYFLAVKNCLELAFLLATYVLAELILAVYWHVGFLQGRVRIISPSKRNHDGFFFWTSWEATTVYKSCAIPSCLFLSYDLSRTKLSSKSLFDIKEVSSLRSVFKIELYPRLKHFFYRRNRSMTDFSNRLCYSFFLLLSSFLITKF